VLGWLPGEIVVRGELVQLGQQGAQLSAQTKTRRAPCPQCNRGPKDTALAITTDERGEVWKCHRCGYSGANNVATNVRAIGRELRPPSPDKLRAIWNRTVPLPGTIGETYLKHRRCALPPIDSDVRFLPSSDRYPPSLCSLVTDAITAQPMTLHFTYLRSDGLGKAGTDRDKRLLADHPKAGGVIRIWPDEAVTHALGIAEGIESALAAAHAFTPVWAMVDAGNMTRFPVLAGIAALTIFADNDEPGLRAARACGQRWADAGHEVGLVVPEHGDMCDAVAAA
jgi:hypothetical protein